MPHDTLQVFKGIRSRECVQVVHQRHIIRAAGDTANRGPGAGDRRKLISLLQWRGLEPLEFGFPLRLEVVSGSPFVSENCTYNSHEVHASQVSEWKRKFRRLDERTVGCGIGGCGRL